MGTNDVDTLILDFPAAAHLADVLVGTATELHHDRVALEPLLDEATAILRRDQFQSLTSIESARRQLDALATDLRTRLGQLDLSVAEIRRLDDLTAQIGASTPLSHHVSSDASRGQRTRVQRMRVQRTRLLMRLVGGDPALAARIGMAIDRGLDLGDALRAANAEAIRERRIGSVMAELDLDLEAAVDLVDRMDGNLAVLTRRGYSEDESLGALALVEQFGLDLSVVLAQVDGADVGINEAVGQLLTAKSLGVSLVELDALTGLQVHFAAFDNPTGGRADGRVSKADLEYVVDRPWMFTDGQVVAAQALLDTPDLRNRLDTADENTDIIGPARFGRTAAGDGLIAEVDLRAFMIKAQLNHILGDYADQIDIAGDPSGVVDGFRSQSDFRRFVADNADLPRPVIVAAEQMLAQGWFDESWWQEHKDELAMGAALLAGGLAVVVTGGAASFLLVAGAAALAAGATTVAVNVGSEDELLDDVFLNSFKGLFVGVGVHSAAAGVGAYVAAGTTVARSGAVAATTAGASDVVAAGGIDLLIPEDDEALIHEVAEAVNMAAGAWEMTYGPAGEWITSRRATFEHLDDQLDALSPTISRQRQGRHVDGALERDRALLESPESPTGYFTDPADAQAVLDAVHDGTGDIIGRTRGGGILVRVEGVEGMNMNNNLPSGQVTDLFMVKGTASPSVVPTSPSANPYDTDGVSL